LQKTNRDTQDVLQALSRVLYVPSSELSVAGTKDKRGVTVQRVCLKRSGKSLVDVWRAINGLGDSGPGTRGMREVLKERGERGVRVSDCECQAGLKMRGRSVFRGGSKLMRICYLHFQSRTRRTTLNSACSRAMNLSSLFGASLPFSCSLPFHPA
jgi:hypothetical protein